MFITADDHPTIAGESTRKKFVIIWIITDRLGQTARWKQFGRNSDQIKYRLEIYRRKLRGQ